MERANPIADLGRAIVAFVTALGAGVVMCGDALSGVAQGGRQARRRMMAMMSLVGTESLPIVLVTLLFAGMVFGLHTAKQLALYGASQYVGFMVAVTMAREVAPTFAGIVVAARIGSAFAAELGSMRITNQVDALRALAANPVHYLVTPRLVSSAIMLPVLTIFAFVTGVFGGGIVAMTAGISYRTFVDSITTYLQMYDVTGGLLKAIVFGVIICITSCYIGLNTEGGAAGVGRSTTAAVVWSIVLLYASNFLMSWMLYAFRS